MTAARASGAVEIRQLKVHADGRGSVFEPLEPALLQGWRNVHTVLTEPGAVRGNHCHLRGTEVTAVLGPALVRYRSGGQIKEVVVPEGEAWRFIFPPGTAHAFKNTGSKPFVLVSFNTEEHDPTRPDVERVELIS
jgi:dTDP-4-dehydrorhamnose 3,5-epimerase-like enzyme